MRFSRDLDRRTFLKLGVAGTASSHRKTRPSLKTGAASQPALLRNS
jgi:hypothetical protein